MAKYLIARAKVLDENGKEIPVDVRTCAEAVTCPDGKTAQAYFQTLVDHMADTVAHPSQTRQAVWDAKETPAGAQAKADDAVTRAYAQASTLVTRAFPEAVREANAAARAMADNAKTDAVREAAANSTAQIGAFAAGKAFVVEQGSVEGWNYRKWSNGTIEAWGSFDEEITLNKVFAVAQADDTGAIRHIRGKIEERTIPAAIGFATAPLIQVDLSCGNYFVWGASGSPSGANKTPAINVMAFHTMDRAVAQIAANYICIGR